MVRIISGQFKSRRLLVPRSRRVRPTSDRVKEALFQILAPRICDASVLDLYAGTGNLGIEALSRGAESCCFVERMPAFCALIRENLTRLELRANSRVLCGGSIGMVKRLHARGERFTLVLADPPYGKTGEEESECKKLLRALDRYDIFSPEAVLVIEHYKKDPPPRNIARLMLSIQRRYGDTVVSFYSILHDENTGVRIQNPGDRG
ncbi:MAG: 16S rRNA (guanine(966)-N(2))-methyltransferase RsmD [Candidatus Aureabacteria bacterium]|nr:16S rRNA (guanine(966)-N(2))-methyltransferase RsmD [Candidatus Auribacterota bacterium]